MVSVAPGYGGVFMDDNTTATSIAVTSTPYVTNWDSNGAATNVDDFSVTTGGRLTYTGTPTIHAHVVCNFTAFVTINASKDLNFYLYKNGTTQLGCHLALTTQGNSDHESTAIHADVQLATNDYIELWCSNETDTNNITLEDAYLFAQGMFM